MLKKDHINESSYTIGITIHHLHIQSHIASSEHYSEFLEELLHLRWEGTLLEINVQLPSILAAPGKSYFSHMAWSRCREGIL